jgi:hypothetical protein
MVVKMVVKPFAEKSTVSCLCVDGCWQERVVCDTASRLWNSLVGVLYLLPFSFVPTRVGIPERAASAVWGSDPAVQALGCRGCQRRRRPVAVGLTVCLPAAKQRSGLGR